MKRIRILLLVLALLPGAALAQEFNVTVSPNYSDTNIVLAMTSSTMETGWFTQRAGGRTIYSNDATIGYLTHGSGSIQAHATWVISYDAGTRTVNINAGRTHITNWWGTQRCHVYEDGTCDCGSNSNWNICAYPPMASYVRGLIAYARGASLNAQFALQQAGYTVTRN